MTDDTIQNFIVLMFENHSFDQMLGCFKAVYPQLGLPLVGSSAAK